MIRRLFILAAAAAVISCSVGRGQEEDVYSPKLRIEWDEFKKLYDEKRVVVVDVRDPASFEAGHIPQSRSIPLDDIEKRIGDLKKQKKPIVTYCA